MTFGGSRLHCYLLLLFRTSTLSLYVEYERERKRVTVVGKSEVSPKHSAISGRKGKLLLQNKSPGHEGTNSLKEVGGRPIGRFPFKKFKFPDNIVGTLIFLERTLRLREMLKLLEKIFSAQYFE